jgi:hypothetical protein
VPVRDCRPTVWDLVAEREADAFWALRGADAPRFVPEPDFPDGVVDDVPDAFRPLAGCLVPPFGGLAIVSSLRGRLWSGMARSRQPRQVTFCFGLPATCNLGLGGHRKAPPHASPFAVAAQTPVQIPTQVTSRPCRLSQDVLSLVSEAGATLLTMAEPADEAPALHNEGYAPAAPETLTAIPPGALIRNGRIMRCEQAATAVTRLSWHNTSQCGVVGAGARSVEPSCPPPQPATGPAT